MTIMIIKSKNACKLTDNISKYSSQIDDIVKYGDPLGKKTEGIINDIIKSEPDLKLHNGKYGSNNGIDHFVENTKTGEVWVIDSKQIAKSKIFEAGAMKVIENGAKNQRQLSEEWIKTVANNLPNKEGELLLKAINEKRIRVALTGINKETRDILFLPIEIKNKLGGR